MQFSKACIPYGGYWSTPFCRWQGSFGHLHALKLGAEVAVGALAQRKISAEVLDKCSGVDELPDTLQISVPVFENARLDDLFAIDLLLEINAREHRFHLVPRPGSLRLALDRAQNMIAAQLAAIVGSDNNIAIYAGAP